jgi:D-alanyl-D-alanine carboxypeptidase
MRKLLVLAMLFSGLFVASATARTSAPKPRTFNPAAAATIDAAAKAGLACGVTGITLGINDPTRGHYVKSYGTSAGTPVTPNMHYRIASVSKTFTADAILRLVQQGRLSLNAPISKFVSGVPMGHRVTIRDLLAMRSGLADYVQEPSFLQRYTDNPLLPGWTPAKTLKIIRASRPMWKPDVTTYYSNTNYVLLGFVIQKVTGESAPRYITSLIHRLGLRNTSFPTTPRLPAPFIHGYVGVDTGTNLPPTQDMTFSNPLVPWTAGALVSTIPDMLKYARELGTGAGLSRQMWKLRRDWAPLASAGVKVQYGLGLTQLGKWIGHDGSIFGYSDMVFYLPSKHVSFVAMVNAAAGQQATAQTIWGYIVRKLYPGTLTTLPYNTLPPLAPPTICSTGS